MLIGMSGFAHSGKDTACDILIHHGVVSKRHAFATPIKEVCNALFGWNDLHAYGEYKELETWVSLDDMESNWIKFVNKVCEYKLNRYGLDCYQLYHSLMSYLTVQEYLGCVGVTTSPREVYQFFGTEVGRNRLDTDIWVKTAPRDDVCIADVRFHNECDFLIDSGATVIRINRTETSPVNPHVSESFINELRVTDEYDNDGTLQDFETWIMNYFNIPSTSKRLFDV